MTLQEREGDSRSPDSATSDARKSVSVAELTCGDVRAQLNDLHDTELEPSVRERLDRHLAQCNDCRSFQRSLRATVRGLQSLPAPDVPTDMRDRLRQRIAQPQAE